MLEVGPGTGNLTIRILEHAKKVIAVEVDPRMAAEVTKRVQGKAEQRKLEVLLGDVIKMEKLPEFDVLISKYVHSAHRGLMKELPYTYSGGPAELASQELHRVTRKGSLTVSFQHTLPNLVTTCFQGTHQPRKYCRAMPLTLSLSDPPDAQPAANLGGKENFSAPPHRGRDSLANPAPSEQLMFQREFALRYVATMHICLAKLDTHTT